MVGIKSAAGLHQKLPVFSSYAALMRIHSRRALSTALCAPSPAHAHAVCITSTPHLSLMSLRCLLYALSGPRSCGLLCRTLTHTRNLQPKAHAALVDSLGSTFLPASPIPGVPTGFDKMTGVAYSSIIELGFVGPQLRMAVCLLQAGLAPGGNATYVHMAGAMLDAWVQATGPGFTHAVWDMQVGELVLAT